MSSWNAAGKDRSNAQVAFLCVCVGGFFHQIGAHQSTYEDKSSWAGPPDSIQVLNPRSALVCPVISWLPDVVVPLCSAATDLLRPTPNFTTLWLHNQTKGNEKEAFLIITFLFFSPYDSLPASSQFPTSQAFRQLQGWEGQGKKIGLGAAAPMIKSKVKCGILLLLVQLPPSPPNSHLLFSRC